MFIKRYWESLLYTAVLLVLSFARMPDVPEEMRFFSWDKVVHVLLYSCYALVLMYDFFKGREVSFRKTGFYVIALLFPALMGGAIEICQGLFFPPRQADFFDWLSNLAGILAGWGIFFLWIRKKKNKA